MKPVIPSSQYVTTDGHEANGTHQGSPDPDPLTIPPRWALCPLDWQAHAIDAWADHPLGVWIARCGHRLSVGTPLYDVPQGQRCPPELCAVEQDHRTRDRVMIEVSDRVPGERVRMVVQGRRTDDNSTCTLVVIHEDSGIWAIHGLGNPGVRVSVADMVALVEAILERAR